MLAQQPPRGVRQRPPPATSTPKRQTLGTQQLPRRLPGGLPLLPDTGTPLEKLPPEGPGQVLNTHPHQGKCFLPASNQRGVKPHEVRTVSKFSQTK